MTTYFYGNQHVTVRSAVKPLVAFVLGTALIGGMFMPLPDRKATQLLKQFSFGQFQPLVVAAEISLPEKPEPKTTQVPKGIKTEIYQYLIEKFGDHAGDAIAIIRTCENGTFDPRRESGINKHKDGHESIDIGVMQINVDVKNTAEIEKLKEYKYNIDRGYAKWKMGDGKKHKNSFYLWTCAKVINQYNYVDAMNGR